MRQKALACILAGITIIPMLGTTNGQAQSLPPPNLPRQAVRASNDLPTTNSAATRLADAYKECKVKRDPADRLQCFDGLSSIADTVGTPKQSSGVRNGSWFNTEQTDRDGSAVSSATLASLDVASDDEEIQKEPNATLFVRCREGETSVYVAFKKTIVGKDVNETAATVRFDDADVLMTLIPSRSGNAVGFWENRSSSSFLSKLAMVQKFSIRLPMWNGNFVRASFDMTGTADAMAPIRAACKW